jgi:hypothetical protein
VLLTLPMRAAESGSKGWQDYREELTSRGFSRRDADEVRRWGVGAPESTIDMAAVNRVRARMGDAWMDAYRAC